MQNCVEAIVAEQACYYFSQVGPQSPREAYTNQDNLHSMTVMNSIPLQVVVPLYDTLGREAVAFIINQASIEIVVCDSPEKVSKK